MTSQLDLLMTRFWASRSLSSKRIALMVKRKPTAGFFISDFIRILPHQSDEVQTAILQLLTGMSGQPAIKAIVDCIKKPAATPVVAAAAESLVKNGQSFEWQLVHTFFSKDLSLIHI